MQRWPFAGWLALMSPERRKQWDRLGADLRRRIERLNPVVIEGARLRGWYPHARTREAAVMWGGITVREFIARYGRAAYRALPREAIKHFGHRKLVRFDHVPRMRATTAEAA